MFKDIHSFLVPGVPPPTHGSNVIKMRTDRFDVQGDASFCTDMSVWRRFMVNGTEEKHFPFDGQALVQASRDWRMPLDRVVIQDSNCLLYFNRAESTRKYFERNREWKDPPKLIGDTDCNALDIDSYRRRKATDAMNRLVGIYKDNFIDQTAPDLGSMKVGACFDVASKRPFSMTYSEYLTKRSTDMQLIAQHKYGLRVQNDKYLRDLVQVLGAAAVIVDLLEAKTSGPVFLASKSNQVANTSSKGASFILYNSARIETLFRGYDERVASGYYSPPPETTDWGLLTEEDEWKLVYNYLLEYQHVLERTVQAKEIQIHGICGFLYKLVGQFSVYYRTTKILTVRIAIQAGDLIAPLSSPALSSPLQENRPHLMPVLHTRIALLRGLRRVLNELLYILGIAPVQQM